MKISLIEGPTSDKFFKAETIPVSNEVKFLVFIFEHMALPVEPVAEK